MVKVGQRWLYEHHNDTLYESGLSKFVIEVTSVGSVVEGKVVQILNSNRTSSLHVGKFHNWSLPIDANVFYTHPDGCGSEATWALLEGQDVPNS